jgi:hypothetical protein
MQNMLKNDRISANIVRPPREIATAGCGYAVRIGEESLSRAKIVLRNGRLLPGKVYIESGNGYREIQL